MNREEIIERLQEIFEDVLDYNEEITEELSSDDVKEWDSLAHITLMATVEDEFSIKIPTEMMPKLKTVKNIIDAIEEL